MPNLIQNVTAVASLDFKSVAVSIGGTPAGVLSLRSADLLANHLRAALARCILPSQAFQWETQEFKDRAVLYCMDQILVTKAALQGEVIGLPFRTAETMTKKICGIIYQQRQAGQAIPEGHYIAYLRAAMNLRPVGNGFKDYEDAQAAVSQAVGNLLA